PAGLGAATPSARQDNWCSRRDRHGAFPFELVLGLKVTSSAGVVLEVGSGVNEFAVGDPVACAGVDHASHAEMNWVPKNLCVKIPSKVNSDSAASVALGAIALQGVRISEAKL